MSEAENKMTEKIDGIPIILNKELPDIYDTYHIRYVSNKQETIEEVIQNFKRINIEYDYLILVKNGIVIGVIEK